MIGRLLALNKVHLRVGEVSENRPIIILSSVFKFLEGWIVKDLKWWNRRNLTHQYGFTGREYIDMQAKRYLINS